MKNPPNHAQSRVFNWPGAGTPQRLLLAGALCLLALGSARALAAQPKTGHVTIKDPAIKKLNRTRPFGKGRPLEIFCHVEGADNKSQRPLVLLHGFMECNGEKGTYRKVYRELAKNRPVVMLDLAGFGRSNGRRGFTMRMKDQAKVVAAVLKEFDIQEADVVGHSYGGGVASALAANSRQVTVKNLVLVDSIGVPFKMPLAGRAMALLGLGRLFARALYKEQRFRDYKRGLYHEPNKLRQHAIDHSLGLFKMPNARRAAYKALRSMASDVGRAWERTVLKRINADQTHVIWGTNDPLMSLDVGRELAAITNATEFKKIDAAGHHVMVEQPAEFVQHLERILAGSPGN